MKTRELTLIAIMISLCGMSMMIFPYIVPFLFIVMSLTFTKKQSVLIGVVLGFLSFIIYGKIMALTSIVLLPLVAILTIWGRDRLLVDDISSRQITLFSLYVFFTQLLVNVLSEVATSIFFSFGLQYVLLSLPLSIGLSVIAAVLVRLFAVPVWKVTSRLYLNYATPS